MNGNAADFVDAAPWPALLVHPDERIVAANERALAFLGAGIVGRHFITILRQPVLLEAIEGCLADGKKRTCEYLTNDGRQDVTYKVSVGAVALEHQRGVFVCFEDVTAFEQVGQMRRDFVANVSHELRTPLTALIGFIETLKGPAKNDETARARFLDIMDDESKRMNRLVGDLLSLSRVEAQERVRPTEVMYPADLIRTAAHSLNALAKKAGVQLETDLPEETVSMVGDRDQLRQVLNNLAENAIKYSGAGSTVTLALTGPKYEPRLRAQAVRLSVLDTGQGIEPHHVPRLTERFYRVDSHRSREMGGTGLGLAIVKHIINRHRGRLKVASVRGQGSCFTVILPVA
ncbi:sensor histidine kinase [Pelagimonas varians]|uniref:histidine kinase n=1 Tax=Pelagimonas varians TaxID=696760 RepID=A0A238JPC8_9RHOB|nr:ATP-binding protein [Pelagimonas varians]PYG34760.1 two-component system phosphate regulon sensor histidine kinase PhoR [Pelagimonas varians]SMX32529.1 Alkaline phosphatase synthesis sensor protein PhoR [Pelagimonas varians]